MFKLINTSLISARNVTQIIPRYHSNHFAPKTTRQELLIDVLVN